LSDRIAIPEDAAGFMEKHRRTFMITLRKDGSPTAHPMAGFFGGSLYLNTYGASAKAKNLGRDERICCLVTNPSDSAEFEAAVYRGRARVVPVGSAGSQEKPDIPPESDRKIGDTAGRVTRGKRVIFEIVPREVGMIATLRDE